VRLLFLGVVLHRLHTLLGSDLAVTTHIVKVLLRLLLEVFFQALKVLEEVSKRLSCTVC
jgi:hypothetical protein